MLEHAHGDQPRLVELDWLRAYAVLMVVLLHVSGIAFAGTALPEFMYSDLSLLNGVDIFFAISGFVISQTLVKVWDRPKLDSATAQELKGFLVKRFWRLWPAAALWITISVVSAVVLWPFWVWPAPEVAFTRWWMGLLYLSNFAELQGHTQFGYLWSLSLEWQFYLLLPLVLLIVPDRRVLALVLVGTIISNLFWRPGGDDWWMFHFDSLLTGILAFMVVRAGYVPRWNLRWMTVPLTGGFIFTLASMAQLIRVGMPTTVAPILTSVLCGVLVWLGSRPGSISSFGVPKIAKWVGNRSYSLYLCHVPLVLIVFTIFSPWEDAIGLPAKSILTFSLSLFVAVVASHFSFQLIEIPTHQFGRALASGAGKSKTVYVSDMRPPLQAQK